jgi:hypothetical protein
MICSGKQLSASGCGVVRKNPGRQLFQINVTLLHSEDLEAGARFLASEYC